METLDLSERQPDFEDFSKCQGGRFRVSVDGDSVDLTLIEATVLPDRSHPARPMPFSLIFLGPKDRRLSQRIHVFEHEELGTFEMFIVPIVPSEQGPRYQAIFN